MLALDLGVGIFTYFLSSLGGVAIVKFLNYRFCFSSWLVLALLSRATWILAFPFAYYLGALCRVSYKQLRIYLVVAAGLSIVEAFNAMSMSVLPGSLYALIKGTDVFWSMILSRLVLGKTYSMYQIVAVLGIVAGIAAVFGMGPPKATTSHKEATEQALQAAHLQNLSVAATLCLVGAFCNSLLSVVTEATLKQTLRAEQQRFASSQKQPPSKLLLSNEYAMWTSLFSFVILAVAAALTGQLSELPAQTKHLSCTLEDVPEVLNTNQGGDTTQQFLLMILSLLSVTLSRFAERLCKHWICVRDSAMTFSVVQAARRLSGVFILAALFGESFPKSMLVGSILAGLGFGLHTWAAIQEDHGRAGLSKEDRDYELVSLTPPTEIDECEEDEETTSKEAAESVTAAHDTCVAAQFPS